MTDPTAFLDLCRQLREMGAVEITAGDLSAKFALPQVVLPAPKPLTSEEQRRARVRDKANAKEDSFPALEGDTEADHERRRNYRDIADTLQRG